MNVPILVFLKYNFSSLILLKFDILECDLKDFRAVSRFSFTFLLCSLKFGLGSNCIMLLQISLTE